MEDKVAVVVWVLYRTVDIKNEDNETKLEEFNFTVRLNQVSFFQQFIVFSCYIQLLIVFHVSFVAQFFTQIQENKI